MKKGWLYRTRRRELEETTSQAGEHQQTVASRFAPCQKGQGLTSSTPIMPWSS